MGIPTETGRRARVGKGAFAPRFRRPKPIIGRPNPALAALRSRSLSLSRFGQNVRLGTRRRDHTCDLA